MSKEKSGLEPRDTTAFSLYLMIKAKGGITPQIAEIAQKAIELQVIHPDDYRASILAAKSEDYLPDDTDYQTADRPNRAKQSTGRTNRPRRNLKVIKYVQSASG